MPSRVYTAIRVFLSDTPSPIQFPKDPVREIRVTTSDAESKLDELLRLYTSVIFWQRVMTLHQKLRERPG